MVSDERHSFAARLRAALLAINQPTSATAFARAYNVRSEGEPVTIHGARKWLMGESFPTQEKLVVLARWLNVHPSWLRFGSTENGTYDFSPPPGPVFSIEQLALVRDVETLSTTARTILREIVDSFVRAAAVGKISDLEKKPPVRRKK
jgi:hypothetical protein